MDAETRQDMILAAIEQRELQFLLSGEYLEQYKRWLKKPSEYKKQIREQAKLVVRSPE